MGGDAHHKATGQSYWVDLTVVGEQVVVCEGFLLGQMVQNLLIKGGSKASLTCSSV